MAEAKELFELSDAEIVNDKGRIHIAERLLQLIVDSLIDVNQHFIKELNLKTPDDLQSTFYIMGEGEVLPAEFARKIAPVVGLRNRIVHRYDTLNKVLFIETFRKNIDDFGKYIVLITDYVEKIKEKE